MILRSDKEFLEEFPDKYNRPLLQRAKNGSLTQAEAEGLDKVTQSLALLIFDALQGNIMAIKWLVKDLNLLECNECYLKQRNPWRDKRYRRIARAARLVGLSDEMELIEKLSYSLITVAMGINTGNGINTVQAYKSLMRILSMSPCPKCKK